MISYKGCSVYHVTGAMKIWKQQQQQKKQQRVLTQGGLINTGMQERQSKGVNDEI